MDSDSDSDLDSDFESDFSDSISAKTKRGGKKKTNKVEKKQINRRARKTKATPEPSFNHSTTTQTTTTTTTDDNSEIKVSMFDYSIENHFRFIDSINKLCGRGQNSSFIDAEVQRLASTITYLSEWRYFNYKPKTIRFDSEIGHPDGDKARNDITLSQFSAAMVPKCDTEAEKVPGAVLSTDSRKDFVLYVGGLVWSLDWCPRTDQGIESGVKCEFLAVAAHPPDSTYHKLGDPLNGRGMIQIWCLLNSTEKEAMQASVGSIKRKYQTNKAAKKGESNVSKPVRPRGRPKKNPIEKPATDPEMQISKDLVVQLPENTMLSTHSSQDISTPISRSKEKHQNVMVSKEENKQKKPRGKARKNPISSSSIEDSEGQFIPALAVQLPEHSLNVPPVDEYIVNDPSAKKVKKRKRKDVHNDIITMNEIAGISNSEGPSFQVLATEIPESMKNISPTEDSLLNTSGPLEETGKRRTSKRVLGTDLDCTLAVLRRRSRNKSKTCNNLDHDNIGLPTENLGEGPSLASIEENLCQKDNMVSKEHVVGDSCLGSGDSHVLKDDVLPRVVLCLGHDGKVAWDVKWRPPNADESVNEHRMGYLAVVLGNGSVEVWEIPSPQVINRIYASRHAKGIDPRDPRFAKLKPVFRCSVLKYDDRQSMPLTVEWSASPPHDFLLAGCHDGVVALWKFSVDVQSEDARPLLCFSAETSPIRALSWAPFEGDPESSNIIVTAGHGGLKFWDLRDPFRPLWDANPSQRFIYGLDWVPDPRCVLVSYDDGTLRMLSISRAAYDVPVTGQPFSGTQQQGLHSYHCSAFAVWNIHVSRLTGMVAYCCADGTVLYFQLTHKAVDKDPLRNRAPHFICSSFSSEESAVTMNTQLPSSPQPMRKSATEWANTPRPARTVATGLNQAKRTRKGTGKGQKPDDQVLALCYGDDAGGVDTNEAQTSVKGGKGKSIKSRKASDDQALVCADRDGDNVDGKPEPKAVAEIEVFPPKAVSMNKVRWNMNKGSEKWLCYGGAAGIVRCQEIFAPEFDKKLLRR
ncbi:uncharacterized protein LOC110729340 [Chenopodium quinoa]|uniref:uncharacterized protein LOC110729340 n=1 Tax=Chenopodium quinoa TaxID=63459 RepID=UPI000B784FD8|nr:uncharacterized protein LOC110729340 [Chenopodium quinoa]